MKAINAVNVTVSREGHLSFDAVLEDGNTVRVNLEPHGMFQIYYAMRDNFDLEDVENELVNMEDCGAYKEDELEYLKNKKEDIALTYRDIRDNSDNWYYDLEAAFAEELSSYRYHKEHDER